MRGVIDQIGEGVGLVVTDAGVARLPLGLLHEGAREGDVVELSVRHDPGATREAKARVADARRDLSRDDDGGDIEL